MFVKKQDALPKVVHMRDDVLLWFWSLCVFAIDKYTNTSSFFVYLSMVFADSGESEGDLQLRVKL